MNVNTNIDTSTSADLSDRTHGRREVYDIFISYSHSGDRELAHSLEKLLWTFGRSWYESRKIRTYRDETNLAAEPNLWPSIERAVQQSRCLLLLACPKSARSEWVPREVKTALESHGLPGLCIAQTGGLLPWTDQIAPQELLGRSESAISRELLQLLIDRETEPVVVDLRPFRSMPERLRLKQPEYLSRVAAIAAKGLGKKDKAEIWGEYHRAQRLRTMFLSSVSLVLLSLVFLLFLALRSERQATLRAQARQLAAESQQLIAESKDIGVDTSILGASPFDILQPSALLAIESLRRVPLYEGAQALRPTIALWPKYLLRRDNYPGVLSLEISPDDRRLVASNVDNMGMLFELPTGKELARFAHPSTEDIVFSPDSRFFALVDTKRWTLFHSADGSPFKPGTVQDVVSMAFSAHSDFIVLGTEHGSIYVHDIKTGKETVLFNAEREKNMGMPTVLIAPDNWHVAVANLDGKVRTYDIASRKEVGIIVVPSAVAAMAFSNDGQYLGTAGEDKVARIFRWPAGVQVGNIQFDGNLTDIVFSHQLPSPLVAAFALGQGVKVFEPVGGREISRMQGTSPLRFSPDGRQLVAGRTVWDVLTGREIAEIPERETSGRGIKGQNAVSPDAKFIATVHDDDTIQLFETHGAREMSYIDASGPVSLTPDGRYVAAATSDGRVELVDTGRRTVSTLPYIHGEVVSENARDRIQSLALSADALTFIDIIANKILTTVDYSEAMDIDAPAISPDGQLVLVGSMVDQGITILDEKTGRSIAQIPLPRFEHAARQGVRAVVFGSSGRLFAVSQIKETDYRDPDSHRESMVRIFDAVSRHEIAHIDPGSDASDAESMVFSPDETHIAVGTSFGDVTVYDVNSGRARSSISFHGGIVAMAFTADGQYVAAGSADHTVRLFVAGTGLEVARFNIDSAILAVAFTPDSKRIEVVATVNGGAQKRDNLEISDQVWSIEELISDGCARMIRNLMSREWETYLPGEPHDETCPNLPVPSDKGNPP